MIKVLNVKSNFSTDKIMVRKTVIFVYTLSVFAGIHWPEKLGLVLGWFSRGKFEILGESGVVERVRIGNWEFLEILN